MKLKDIYSENTAINGDLSNRVPKISFEIYPPKDDADGSKLEKLMHHLLVLKKFSPAFVSLTYGAGGATRENSLHIIERIQKEVGLNIMPHFTCVATKKSQISEYLKNIQELNIENILALRGDIPLGMDEKDFDFKHANEIVEFIKTETDLSVGVAGYPEGHISCDDFELDMKYLKQKADAGADAIFTQMFFDNQRFFYFRDFAENLGIKTPIAAGILPITSYKQLDRMLSMGRVTLPNVLSDLLEKHKENPEDIKKIGIDFATYQCQELIKAGVCGLHFFSLNSSTAVSEILTNLSID